MSNKSRGIGWAIKQMMGGAKVNRVVTAVRGQYIQIQFPDSRSKMTDPYIYITGTSEFTHIVPWTPSQADLLAVDWQVVDG